MSSSSSIRRLLSSLRGPNNLPGAVPAITLVERLRKPALAGTLGLIRFGAERFGRVGISELRLDAPDLKLEVAIRCSLPLIQCRLYSFQSVGRGEIIRIQR